MIAIIDGCGANIASLQFALKRLGYASILTVDKAEIAAASHVILPGVGTAKAAMAALNKNKLSEFIPQLSQPVLGICLGMQLMYEFSYEGEVQTLKIMQGAIKPFRASAGLSVPHMGWNQLILEKACALTNNLKQHDYVYFVHGYYADISQQTKVSTQYGCLFSALVQVDNFYGVQFHPERSAAVGEKILANFLKVKS